jgi:hypothetical protein
MGVVTGSSSVWPSFLGLSRVVQPNTILLWHRAGFRAYWRWKSGGRAGRPKIDPDRHRRGAQGHQPRSTFDLQTVLNTLLGGRRSSGLVARFNQFETI